MPWGLQRKCKFCVSRAISEYWQAGGIDGGMVIAAVRYRVPV